MLRAAVEQGDRSSPGASAATDARAATCAIGRAELTSAGTSASSGEFIATGLAWSLAICGSHAASSHSEALSSGPAAPLRRARNAPAQIGVIVHACFGIARVRRAEQLCHLSRAKAARVVWCIGDALE